MKVTGGYYNSSRGNPFPTPVAFRAAQPEHGWCDEPADASYNRPVMLPFGRSCETLIRKDPLYDTCIVLDWNIRERRRGAGSAIFLHIAKPDYPPTAGCIAVSHRDMALLLPHIRCGTSVAVTR